MTAAEACGAMDLVMDARETFCVLAPHACGDHDDGGGHTWPREDWEDE